MQLWKLPKLTAVNGHYGNCQNQQFEIISLEHIFNAPNVAKIGKN